MLQVALSYVCVQRVLLSSTAFVKIGLHWHTIAYQVVDIYIMEDDRLSWFTLVNNERSLCNSIFNFFCMTVQSKIMVNLNLNFITNLPYLLIELLGQSEPEEGGVLRISVQPSFQSLFTWVVLLTYLLWCLFWPVVWLCLKLTYLGIWFKDAELCRMSNLEYIELEIIINGLLLLLLMNLIIQSGLLFKIALTSNWKPILRNCTRFRTQNH